MSLKNRLAFADAEIEKSLKAFETRTWDPKDFPKISDSEALDIIARSASQGVENYQNKIKSTEDSAKITAVLLATLSRTGRSRDDFKYE